MLGARNEAKLRRLERLLCAAAVPHAAIREPDAPYSGQLMAVGLVPAARAAVAAYVTEFQLLPTDP